MHLQVLSIRRAPGKLKYLAGSESGMGVWINDVLPEDAARRLREQDEAAGDRWCGLHRQRGGGDGAARGHQVAILDDLSTGHADAVPAGAAFTQGLVRDQAQAMLADGVDAVLHFAAKSLVAESVAKPSLYWGNNLGGSLALLEAMRQTGVARIVFSSTAAVYGEPERTPIEETAPARPTSPYGASKLAVDTALTEHARMHKIGAVSLRYFNVAAPRPGRTGGGWGSGTTRRPT